MFKKVDKLLIFTAIIVVIIGILAIFMSRTNVEINTKKSENMNLNYSTTESNTWDISANGDGHVTAILSEDGILTISGTGEMKDWGNGDTPDWNGIKDNVKSVIIEEGTTSIGSYAFYSCQNLTSIEIPCGMTIIGEGAFSYCKSLTSMEIPEGVTSIGEGAFYGCKSLTSIEIPESVTSIGESAFYSCSSLTNIVIPKGVTSIEDNAFSWCTSLTSIEIPDGVTSIGNSAFYNCSSLTSIEIPDGVTSIGKDAFCFCSSLTSIEIPDGVTSVEDNVFCFCSSLTSIEIPDGVTSIGERVFSNCSSLTSIEIPDGVTSIGEGAFSSCSSLTSIEIPASVTSIGNSAFGFCRSLTSIEIPDGVTSVGDNAFYNCSSLTSIEIPGTVTCIGTGSFFQCEHLINIEIPNSVTSIGERAFYGCTSLTSIGIPDSVTSIGESAFSNCRSLTSIEVDESNTAYMDDNGVLYTKDETEIIIYPAGKKGTEYTIFTTVINIWDGAFSNCQSLRSIKIPDGVTSIGDGAFSACSSLGSIEIPDGVTSIGNDTFSGCLRLTSIETTDGVTSIGERAFLNCQSLTSIEIPDSVTSIGERAFSVCSSLTSIVIPASVTSIGCDAFAFCTVLTIYCRSNTTVEEYAIDNNISYVIDDEVPTIESVTGNANEWTKEDVTLTINGAEDSLSGLAEMPYSFDGGTTWQAENTKTYEENTSGIVIKVKDKLDNIYTHEEINITKIDKVVPIIEGVTGNQIEWTNENVTLVINATDDLSEFGESSYSFDGGATWQEENTKTYEDNTNGIVVKVKDQAGNETTYEEIINIIKIDKQAPIVESVSGNATEWTKENVTLTINAQDNLSGLAEKAYSFDGGATWQEENTKTYEDNTSRIVVKVKDQAGNITTYEETIEITKIDKQAPIVESVSGNATEWTKGNVTLTINGAQDELSGLAEKPYSFDGGETWQAKNTKTYSTNTSKIIIAVKDSVGNIQTYEEIDITKIDKQLATITSVEGNVTEWTKGNVILTINAQDSLSGLAEKPYSFDGGTTWQAEKTKIYTENATGIIIKVKDQAGNETTYEETINITKIDKQAPIITSIEGNPTEWTKENVALTINAQDNLSGLDEKAYSFDGGETWQVENIKTYTENTSGIAVKVKDQAGNVTTYDETIEITKIDKQAPTITSVEGNPTEWTKGNATLTINAQDNLSGLAEEPYSFDGGETWQVENTKTYIENTTGIIIKVKDKLDNIATYDEINIDKISELEIELESYEEKQGENNTYITNISPETTIGDFIENIDTNGTIEIYKGTEKITDTDTNIGTGMKVKITLNKEQKEYAIVVKGDINGDGKVKLSDFSKLKLSVIGTTQLEGAYKEAADLNGDGNVKLSDFSKMKLYLVGKATL